MPSSKSNRFEELKTFINEEMQMSHIYQPVMLIEILRNGGKASVEQIARAILERDPTQIEYYSQIVKNMVGRVLTNSRGITKKNKNNYEIENLANLSYEQIAELLGLLERKIEDFSDKRGGSQWAHRSRIRKPISGSTRFEVLKQAKFHCELCGISADVKNLEVDHIIPKSLGGSDELSNFQALCYTCNAQKGNRDKTDFRKVNEEFEFRDKSCLFCEAQLGKSRDIRLKNALAFSILDAYPVSKGHLLIIPNRHIEDFFSLSPAEINSVNALLFESRKLAIKDDSSIQGFNVGINSGAVSGQTIFHCHIHLIPRRVGDVENPKGGVRNIFPGKGDYE
jgi:diadenosine tetraphosphate (Ap4A) HIT family hydrolase/5-methylcytosine-specific restriction endonuclease McrA